MSSRLYFASSNRHKFEEARSILAEFGIGLKFFRCSLEEVQAETLEHIAHHKSEQAHALCRAPVIVEDDGLFIDSIKGFPGPYSSFVYGTIGNRGILRVVSGRRSASFRSVIAFCEEEGDVMLFGGEVGGKISKKIAGKGWGFDPIFVPDGRDKTYAQLGDKNLVSHRYIALKKFANWYLHRPRSTG